MKRLWFIFLVVLPLCGAYSAQASEISLEDVLYKGMINQEEAIDVSECQPSRDEAYNCFRDLVNTNPDLWFVGFGLSWSLVDDVVVSIKPEYIDTADNIVAVNDKVTERVEEICKDITEETDIVKIKYVYDWIIDNTRYDFQYVMEPYTTLLFEGKGCCGAYSLLFKRFMDELDIPCIVVISDNYAHGWNQVKLDNEWYNIDATWGRTFDMARKRYKYFLKSDTDFLFSAHPEFSSGYGCTDTKYDNYKWR